MTELDWLRLRDALMEQGASAAERLHLTPDASKMWPHHAARADLFGSLAKVADTMAKHKRERGDAERTSR